MNNIDDPLLVGLSAPTFPPFVRLCIPDIFGQVTSQRERDTWAIITVPAACLMKELGKYEHAAGYPNDAKLAAIKDNLRKSIALEVPVLNIQPTARMPNFSIHDGRHRITVLTELGAKVIPTAVP